MPSCNIIYDNNPNGIYYSGQTLSGVIQLTNDKKRSVRGVTLRIEGYAMVKHFYLIFLIMSHDSHH